MLLFVVFSIIVGRLVFQYMYVWCMPYYYLSYNYFVHICFPQCVIKKNINNFNIEHKFSNNCHKCVVKSVYLHKIEIRVIKGGK